MHKKPQIIETKTLAKTRLFHVQQQNLKFSNGTLAQYETLKSGSRGAVLVVPMQDANTVLMIREYAAGVDRYELALPKGRIEQDEAPIVAANRELMEETGYGANKLRLMKSLTLAPGYFGHVTHVVLAEDLYEKKLEGDEPEEIEVVPWDINQLNTLLQRDDCTEARSIAALYMVKELFTNKPNAR